MKKLWTVKEVCDSTGLTGKHLFYFHHEGVVKAATYSNYSVDDHDGYKLYDEAGVAKLQQVAMYYELGLKRNEIRDLMKAPDYDMHRALDHNHDRLEEKRMRSARSPASSLMPSVRAVPRYTRPQGARTGQPSLSGWRNQG